MSLLINYLNFTISSFPIAVTCFKLLLLCSGRGLRQKRYCQESPTYKPTIKSLRASRGKPGDSDLAPQHPHQRLQKAQDWSPWKCGCEENLSFSGYRIVKELRYLGSSVTLSKVIVACVIFCTCIIWQFTMVVEDYPQYVTSKISEYNPTIELST